MIKYNSSSWLFRSIKKGFNHTSSVFLVASFTYGCVNFKQSLNVGDQSDNQIDTGVAPSDLKKNSNAQDVTVMSVYVESLLKKVKSEDQQTISHLEKTLKEVLCHTSDKTQEKWPKKLKVKFLNSFLDYLKKNPNNPVLNCLEKDLADKLCLHFLNAGSLDDLPKDLGDKLSHYAFNHLLSIDLSKDAIKYVMNCVRKDSKNGGLAQLNKIYAWARPGLQVIKFKNELKDDLKNLSPEKAKDCSNRRLLAEAWSCSIS